MMTRGQQQDILFDPGHYSLDPDEDAFDPSVRVSFLAYTDDMNC